METLLPRRTLLAREIVRNMRMARQICSRLIMVLRMIFLKCPTSKISMMSTSQKCLATEKQVHSIPEDSCIGLVAPAKSMTKTTVMVMTMQRLSDPLGKLICN